jgi:CheY-like chemotaxis protein
MNAVSSLLIIEDSATTRAVIKAYLVGHHFNFIEGSEGQEGLRLARQHHPDVIVVDLKMPGMDGFTFCRTVRADARLKETPIILLTSSKGADVKREAIAAGASHFMTKPTNGEELAQRIVSFVKEKQK